MRRTAVRNAVVLVAVVLAGLLAGEAGAAFRNPDGVAVIIGNRTYQHGVPEVTYAHRDAEAFRRYVIDVLGFDPANVIYKKDADKAILEGVFGNRESLIGSELWRYLHPKGHSDVVVFYSGHGIPGLDDKRGYLLPVNAHPDRAKLNGYQIDVLYANLVKLKAENEARSVQVFLDACFSGDSGGGRLLTDTSAIGVAPIAPTGIDELTILTAASGTEVASWDKAAKHGLFTHHLLDALYGGGDADADGQVTAAEAKDYLDEHMTKAARKQFGRVQNADLRGMETEVLVRVVGGKFPQRQEIGPERQEEESEKLHGNVQTALRGVGFDPGLPDGQWSESASRALQAYQRVKGMDSTGEPSKQLLDQLQRDRVLGWHNRTCRTEETLERPESCSEECREVQRTRQQCDIDYKDFKEPCNLGGNLFRNQFDAEEFCESDYQGALRRAELRCGRGTVENMDYSCTCYRSGRCSCDISVECESCVREPYHETVCPDRCPQRTVKQKVCECKAPEFCN